MKKKHLFPLVSMCFYSANTFITSMEEHVNKIWRRSTSEREEDEEGGIYIFITATEANVGVRCIRGQKQSLLRFILSQQQSPLSRRGSCLQVCGGETQIMEHHAIKRPHNWGE